MGAYNTLFYYSMVACLTGSDGSVVALVQRFWCSIPGEVENFVILRILNLGA